jgi:hypothetical protein
MAAIALRLCHLRQHLPIGQSGRRSKKEEAAPGVASSFKKNPPQARPSRKKDKMEAGNIGLGKQVFLRHRLHTGHGGRLLATGADAAKGKTEAATIGLVG